MRLSSLHIYWRKLRKSVLYSSIKIAGLAVGIGCMLLALIFWKQERNFDTFHANIDNLYRITTTISEGPDQPPKLTGGTGQVQGQAFSAAIPEILHYTRVMGGNIKGDVRARDKALQMQLLFVDSSFFDVFSFPLLTGNPQSALDQVGSAIISETAARKLFNSTDVVGKQLDFEADPSARKLGKPLVITGVAADPPGNSSIQFDVLLPFSFMQLSFEDKAWLNAYLGTFVVIHPSANVPGVIQKMDDVFTANAGEQLRERVKNSGFKPEIKYGLQNISKIHLNPLEINSENGIAFGSAPMYSYGFMIVAIIILLMASINFINISIADSLKNIKEVQVRKILGGSRGEVLFQLISHTAFICAISFCLGIVFSLMAAPLFRSVTGTSMSLWEILDSEFILYTLILFCSITILSGLYPAWLMSGVSSGRVTMEKVTLSGRHLFGKILVVMQVSLAVFLLMSLVIYYRQISFLNNKDLGYDPSQVIVTNIKGERERAPVRSVLKNELSKTPAIQLVSFGGGESIYDIPVGGRKIAVMHKVIDANYFSVMQIPLISGRYISTAFPSDRRHSVVVNEAFVKAAGLENPVGTLIQTDPYFDKEQKIIVGVVKDYHARSLRNQIPAMVFFENDWYGDDVYVKIGSSRQKEALTALEEAYKKSMPGAVYQYEFLQELNAKAYARELKWREVITLGTVLSLIISCLGLFGLAHLSAQQRLKEIGTRKILGASVLQIVSLLTLNFHKLVFIGFVIAAPVAWWLMDSWLNDFAYHYQPGYELFVFILLLSFALSFIGVGVQAIKAAKANPVKCLKVE